jgi:hypothetical protein
MSDRALWALPLVLGGAMSLGACDEPDGLGQLEGVVGPSFRHPVQGQIWTLTSECSIADPSHRVVEQVEQLEFRATPDPWLFDVVVGSPERGFTAAVIDRDALEWTRVVDGRARTGTYTFREDGTFDEDSRIDDLEPPAAGDCEGTASVAP